MTTSSGNGADFLNGIYTIHPLKGEIGLSLDEGSIKSMNKLYSLLESSLNFGVKIRGANFKRINVQGGLGL